MPTLKHKNCGDVHLDLSSFYRVVSVGMRIQIAKQELTVGVSDIIQNKKGEPAWLCMKCGDTFTKNGDELQDLLTPCNLCMEMKPVSSTRFHVQLGNVCEDCMSKVESREYEEDSIHALVVGAFGSDEELPILSDILFYKIKF